MSYGPDAFQRDTNVSRETLERFKTYAELLERWQRRINLVSNSSLTHVWQRHFMDSAQIVPYLPARANQVWDIGAGAGFPGLVLAIMGVPGICLIEADERKCAFLREAARVTGAPVSIVNTRLDGACSAPSLTGHPDVVVGRAVAPIEIFLDIVSERILCHTCCIVHKGERYEEELSAARHLWCFDHFVHQSMTHPRGVVLVLRHIRRSIGETQMGDAP